MYRSEVKNIITEEELEWLYGKYLQNDLLYSGFLDSKFLLHCFVMCSDVSAFPLFLFAL
jgi:hypothetical protein